MPVRFFFGSLPVSSISHGQHCFDGSAGGGHLCYGPLPRLSVVGMLPCHQDPFVVLLVKRMFPPRRVHFCYGVLSPLSTGAIRFAVSLLDQHGKW